MTNLLITGGTGFLGRNLQKAFSSTGINCHFIGRGENNEYNLIDYSKTQKVFYDTKPDIVIHAAATVGGIGFNKKNPAVLIRDNLKIGINVLDAAVEFNVKNLYITSTCCSYPKFCPTPFKEDDLWNGAEEETNSAYGVAKKAIIKMSQAYRTQFGLKTTCFILANLYGIYDHFDDLENSHVVPALIHKIIDAKKNDAKFVRCWGTGAASRDLLFCEDIALALVKAVETNFDYDKPVNLGTGKDITIYDLAYMIKDIISYSGEIVFTGEISDGQPKRLLDTSRADKLLGWNSTTNLIDGLKKTIKWYESQ